MHADTTTAWQSCHEIQEHSLLPAVYTMIVKEKNGILLLHQKNDIPLDEWGE